MKVLHTHFTGAGVAITAIQFYNHFVNSPPVEYVEYDITWLLQSMTSLPSIIISTHYVGAPTQLV